MKIHNTKGGGARGLFPARIGQRLEAERPGWDADVDVRSGASTGGIIALARASGKSWTEIVELYRDKSKVIFADSIWDNIADLSVGGLSLRGAQYSSEGLRDVVSDLFGDMRLGDLDCDVLIPALDLDNGKPEPGRRWKAKFFNRRDDGNELVADVAMRTSAAPTYFPSYQGYVDGGLIANDPTICALVEVLRVHLQDGLAALLTGSVSVLSFGTGTLPKWLEGEENDWGGLQWARHLLDAFMDGGVMTPAYQAVGLLEGRYHEIDVQLKREIPLDGDAWKGPDELEENLRQLVELADDYDIEPTLDWLERYAWAAA